MQNIPTDKPETRAAELARALGGVTILQKGAADAISDGAALPPIFKAGGDTLAVTVPGGLKRVGGQGDILSGTTAALLAWGREWARGAYEGVGHAPSSDEDQAVAQHVALLAAYGASAFNRTVSRTGWERRKRAMVTHDLVDIVGEVYEDMFGQYQEEESKGKL
jgi:ATP-dependent NAD(P)H-hydrate dehydratase